MKLSIAIGALALTTGTALGGAVVTHEDSFNAFGATMPYGSGNSNSNFTIARTTDAFGDIEIGLKAKERFVGNLPTDGAGRYFANAGSPDNDGLGSWNFDFGFSLPQDVSATNYEFLLMIDFDPGFGTQSWVTLDIGQSADNFSLLLPLSPVGGDSQNLGSPFWSISTSGIFALDLDASGWMAFDPNALGEYDVRLVVNSVTGAPLAEAAIVVEVIPAPGAMALIGLGGLVATRRRR